MKNNKLNTSNYLKRFGSADLFITQRVVPNSLKHRYVPENPLVFSLQSKNRSKFEPFSQQQSTYYGVFSLEKAKTSKAREQRQDFQKTKIHTFNIKKILDKSIKEESFLKGQKTFYKVGIKERLDRNMQTKIWKNLVQNEIKNCEISNQLANLNRDQAAVTTRSKNTKSQVVERRNSRLLYKSDSLNEQSLEKSVNKERAAYFVNNFIKTRIKRRAQVDQSPLIKNSKQRAAQLNVVGRRQTLPEINWVIPWQKSHDTEEDNFIQS